MELDWNEKLLIVALRNFDDMFYHNAYMGPCVTYNDRDGDWITYKGYGKRNKNYEIKIFYCNRNFEIIISKPTNFLIIVLMIILIIISFGIILKGSYFNKIIKHFPQQRSFSVNEVFKSLQGDVFLEKELDDLNYAEVIQAYKNFIQTHLMPVIRGEMWIDELIKQKNKHKQDTGKI